MKIKNLAAVATLAAASLAAHADGVPQYSFTDLGMAAGSAASLGTSISSSGNYVVGRNYASSSGVGFVWSASTGRVDWTMPATPKFALLPSSSLSNGGVNNLGTAVYTLGTSATGGTTGAYLWSGGTLSALAVPTGTTLSRASDINDSGTAVGQATMTISGASSTKALMFNTATNTSSIITATSVNGSYMTNPRALNNAGLVVGTGLAADNTTAVGNLIYNSVTGSMTELDLSGLGVSGAVSLNAVSENGWIAGNIGSSAFTWSAASGAHLITPLTAGFTMTAYGINDSGMVVGRSGSNSYFFDGTTSYALDSLLPAGSGWTYNSGSASVYGIANDGSIIATAAGGGAFHAMLLSPVPEPTSWALMLAGMVGVGAVVRRRSVSALGR